MIRKGDRYKLRSIDELKKSRYYSGEVEEDGSLIYNNGLVGMSPHMFFGIDGVILEAVEDQMLDGDDALVLFRNIEGGKTNPLYVFEVEKISDEEPEDDFEIGNLCMIL